jgi:hypothetical protein
MLSPIAKWLVSPVLLLAAVSCPAHAADDFRLSTLGYGPARFGMTLDEAAHALGVELMVDGEMDEPLCYYARPIPAIEGLMVMLSQGRVVRFDVGAPGIRTRSGLGIGDSEAHVLDVLRAQSVEVTPHKYVAPDGNYLTVWSSDRRAAVRFETLNGKVTSFYAGQVPQVTYVEGCS